MLGWLIVIQLITIKQLYGDTLTCDGVQQTAGSSSIFNVAGVCVSWVITRDSVTTSNSQIYDCKNGTMYHTIHTGTDCTNGTIRTGPYQITTVSMDVLSVDVACDLGYCEYVKVREYSVGDQYYAYDADDCNSFIPSDTSSYYDSIYVNGVCVPFSKVSILVECDGKTASRKTYTSVTDCSGTPELSVQVTTLGSGSCATVTPYVRSLDITGTPWYQYFLVECGTAGSNISTYTTTNFYTNINTANDGTSRSNISTYTTTNFYTNINTANDGTSSTSSNDVNICSIDKYLLCVLCVFALLCS